MGDIFGVAYMGLKEPKEKPQALAELRLSYRAARLPSFGAAPGRRIED